MIKITGKIFLALVLLVSDIYSGITMQLQTTNGKPLSYALVGQPFAVEVEISDMPRDAAEPKIFASSEIQLQRTGLYMSSVNGRATKKYSYLARIDTPGVYTIGPTTIDHNGYIYQSEEYSLEVIQDEEGRGQGVTKKVKSQSEDVFLRLSVGVSHAVVGQKIPCTIRFYTNDTSVHLQHLSPSVIKNASLSHVQGPVMGKEEINGKQYQYAQWSWNVYPKTSGEFVIPAYSADYEVKNKKERFRGLASLLSFSSNDKRIYSNSATITVEELPYSDKRVVAVGEIDNFSATITPGIAKEGEGVILTLSLEGDCNWQDIECTHLENIPDALKYYESNVIVQESDDKKRGKKQFEFILQGIESGNWEIPSQEFVYFDTRTHEYKTLYTSPIEMGITPNAQFAAQQKNNILPDLPTDTKEDVSLFSSLFVLNTSFSELPEQNKNRSLDWFFFYLCALFPVFGFIAFGRGKNYILSSRFYYYVLSYVYMKKIIKKLDELEKENRVDQLHSLIILFISEQEKYFMLKNSNRIKCIQEHAKDLVIRNKPWKEFYKQIVAVSFDLAESENSYKQKELFQDARDWIYLIYKKIR